VYVILLLLSESIFILVFRWNPLVYAVRNENIRRFLPFYKNPRTPRKSKYFLLYLSMVKCYVTIEKIADPTRFSVYPYSVVHLPLPSRPSFQEI